VISPGSRDPARRDGKTARVFNHADGRRHSTLPRIFLIEAGDANGFTLADPSFRLGESPAPKLTASFGGSDGTLCYFQKLMRCRARNIHCPPGLSPGLGL
jgi:hypothetical protein